MNTLLGFVNKCASFDNFCSDKPITCFPDARVWKVARSRDYWKHFVLLPVLHKRLSFQKVFMEHLTYRIVKWEDWHNGIAHQLRIRSFLARIPLMSSTRVWDPASSQGFWWPSVSFQVNFMRTQFCGFLVSFFRFH